MFSINDIAYTEKDLHALFQSFEQMPSLQNSSKKRVAYCTTSLVEGLALCLYMREKGGSVVPIHPATPREAAIQIAHRSQSHLLLYGDRQTPIIMINEHIEKTGVLVQMSSGTTGEPKCIERSWEEIDKEIAHYNKLLPVEVETVPIIACPITHSYGLISGVLSALQRGVEPRIIDSLNPKYVWKVLKENDRHLFYASPALLQTLLPFLPEGNKLHYVMTSGTLLSSEWLETLHRKSAKVLQQYGCSEAGCVAINGETINPNEMGIPLAHLSVRAGVSNENPEEIVIYNGEKMIHTKDLGYFSDHGKLCLLGRMDDMINVAGLNVYPQEVEEVVARYPDIKEVIAFKKADNFAGERVCIQFVADTFIESNKIRAWCHHHLAAHQVPVDYIQVKEIQKLPNGKVSRKRLAEGRVTALI